MATKFFFSAAAAILSAMATILIPAPANAIESRSIPTGVVRDVSYDDSGYTVALGGDQAASRAFCPDKAFTAVVVMSTSVPGCNVIGTTASTTVSYGWYKHEGNASPCIWGKGFNSKAQPVWPALDCGSGRTKAVSWGKVAASKQIKGLTAIGWAGVQWS